MSKTPSSAAIDGQLKELVIGWRLQEVAARNGFRFAKDLHAAVVRAGYSVSAASIARLFYGAPSHLNLQLLAVLCEVLSCTPNDLLLPN